MKELNYEETSQTPQWSSFSVFLFPSAFLIFTFNAFFSSKSTGKRRFICARWQNKIWFQKGRNVCETEIDLKMSLLQRIQRCDFN